jgi:hypothetical protein|tara:strand:- start:36150 stop:36689 length:540 start_codon:yes stop_codon:yes gene_type:complete
MANLKNTRSKTYIIPIVSEYVTINKDLLITSYLYDINFPDINIDKIEGLFLLFSWSENSVHKLYEDTLIQSPHITKHYDVDQKHYMIYFKFPREIKQDIKYIVSGEFSKVSDESKKLILKYWQSAQNSKVYGILTKAKKYREKLEDELNVTISVDAELGDKLNYHEETFNQIIKKLVVE